MWHVRLEGWILLNKTEMNKKTELGKTFENCVLFLDYNNKKCNNSSGVPLILKYFTHNKDIIMFTKIQRQKIIQPCLLLGRSECFLGFKC